MQPELAAAVPVSWKTFPQDVDGRYISGRLTELISGRVLQEIPMPGRPWKECFGSE